MFVRFFVGDIFVWIFLMVMEINDFGFVVSFLFILVLVIFLIVFYIGM